MEEQKPPHGSLEGYRTGNTKLATFKDVCLLLYLSPRGWRLACSPCRLSGLTLSSSLLELNFTSHLKFLINKNVEWRYAIGKEPLNAPL